MIALANILGLLGLLSIIGLIIIYIIKPNFQQKVISSTFVWKLSLKYRRKRIPVNKLRNLLLILCQVLILTSCALILAKPVLRADQPELYTEKVIVIDASVAMKSEYSADRNVKPTTRFQRAIDQVKVLVNEVLSEEDGKVTIIIAGEEAYLLEMDYIDVYGNEQKMSVMRLDPTYLASINEKLDLIADDFDKGIDEFCAFGASDVDGAMRLAEDVLSINPECEVLFYTGTEYTDAGMVTVVDVKEEGEKNAAILNGSTTINEFLTYTFKVDVAVYGADVLGAQVKFTVRGANASLDNPSGVDLEPYTMYVDCTNNMVQTVEFNTWTAFNEADENGDYGDAIYNPAEGTVFNFNSVYVEIIVVESDFVDVLAYDDSFFFYGGNTHTINVQYASTLPNLFMNAVTSTWQIHLANKWNVVVNEVQQGEEYATEGFDIYIFEHEMPDELPTDGVVLLFDPDSFSALVGIAGMGEVESEGWDASMPLSVANVKHPLMKHLVGEDISVTRTMPFTIDGAGWESLMTVSYTIDDGLSTEVTFPVLSVLNEPTTKIMLFSLDLNRTNMAMETYWPLFMMDVFNYFFPATMTDFLYEIGETATFNCFSNIMECTTPSDGISSDYVSFTDFPASLELDKVGTYTLSQSLLSGRVVTTEFYVKIPASESNVFRVEDELPNPYVSNDTEDTDLDLLIWFAAALVALLFAEWWLQSRDQF